MSVAAATREQSRARYPDEEGFVERDGVRVFYEVYATGGPTVLLLPTWALIHSRHWKMQIPFLARHCRVVTFDGRGNGRSDRPRAPRHTRSASSRPTRSRSWTRRRRNAPSSSACRARRSGASCSPRSIRSASPAPRSSGRPSRWRRRCPNAPSIPSTSGSIPTKGGRSTTCTTGCGTIGTSSSSSSGSASRSRTRRSRSRTPSAGRSRRPPRCSRTTTPASTCRSAATSGSSAGAFAVRCSSCTATRTRCHSHARGAALAEATGGQLVTLEGSGHFPQARDPVVINLLVQEFVERLP